MQEIVAEVKAYRAEKRAERERAGRRHRPGGECRSRR
jgi:hypothetical protein